MKKMSKAMEKVMEDAKRSIDIARSYETFEEYVGNTDTYAQGRGGAEYVKANIESYEWQRKYWENAKQGMPLVKANSNTIKALAEMGLIEIINDGKNFPDTIKVVNY